MLRHRSRAFGKVLRFGFKNTQKFRRATFPKNLTQTGLTLYPRAPKDFGLLHKYIKVGCFSTWYGEKSMSSLISASANTLGFLVIFILDSSFDTSSGSFFTQRNKYYLKNYSSATLITMQ